MTFGVTPQGFKAKQFEDLLREISSDLKSELDMDINSSSDELGNIYTNIITLAISDAWKIPQEQQGMFSINSAEDTHLEDLVNYIGLSREQAAPTQGEIYITASREFTLPANNSFYDIYNREFLNPSELAVKTSRCTNVTFKFISGIPANTVVSITIQGETSSVTMGSDYEAAVQSLVGDILSKDNKATATATLNGVDSTIEIVSETLNNNMSIIPSSFLTVDEITSKGIILLTEDGAIQVLPNEVTTPPSFEQIISVTNRNIFIEGRLRESDEDLRARHAISLSNTGSCTVGAIQAALSNVTGVTNAVVIENDTMTANDMPIKSFHCVVQGGSDQDIANTIWDNKAGGIETHGNTQVGVLNSQRDTKYVKFSRLEPIYIHAKISYKKYQEDGYTFPAGGEDLLKARLVTYGSSLATGKDLIPQKFAADLLINTSGVEDVVVSLVQTVSPHDQPSDGSYTKTTPIPIELWEQALFDSSRVSVEERL